MTHIELNGEWRLKAKDVSLKATVPGDVHGALLAAGKIPDPYYRDNEKLTQWIGEADWIYERSFTIDRELLDHDRVLLCCAGLDTVATVRVNGKRVGDVDNQFRTWEFDVKTVLKPGRNKISVAFTSPLKYQDRKARAARPIPGWGVPDTRVSTGSWIRKSCCNFGWDWGPKMTTCGIWRDIRITGFSTARISDVCITQKHGGKTVDIGVTVKAEATVRATLTAEVALRYKGRKVAGAAVVLRRGKGEVKLKVRNPRLWWPNGMGEQPLYEADLRLLSGDGSCLDTAVRRIGLRRLELVRKKDKWGESFCFAVNGKKFFAKGANWIPGEAVLSRMTPDDYRRLLGDAAAVNMNMVRVWGGGIYEHDVFYDICDELGLCVWQDFMFACTAYPTFDDEFLANVEQEAVDNVKRLRHHACIALWCGNNELEQGLVGPKWDPWQMSWDDYGRLFDKLLRGVVARYDGQRSYWPCSPHSPHGDRADHKNPACGDAHLWEVWHGRQPFEWYRGAMHRFVSEFGFQSFPEPRVVHGYTLPEDRNVTSPIMEWHQRSRIGNTAIMQYMLDWFRLPKNLDMTLWLSQVLQALAIRYAVEHWRRNMPRTMGAIYWQLNDCWPVASWASIDYPGNWKALHYAAAEFFAPVLVSGVEDAVKGRAQIHVSNDLLKTFKGKLVWTLTTAGGKTLVQDSFPVSVGERSSRKVKSLDLRDPLGEYGARDLIVWLSLYAGNEVVSRNTVMFARPKEIDWPDPGAYARVKATGKTTFSVRLRVKRVALWLWLDAGRGARYSDNFFHMRPGEEIEMQITMPGPSTAAAVKKRLRIRSLHDTYR